MPIYECLTTQGTLDQAKRKRFAEAVTAIHCEETNASADFVHVVFPELPEGHSFTGGNGANPALIRGQVRAGRPPSVRNAIINRVFSLYEELTGADRMSILVAIIDVPASWAMEGGMICPSQSKPKRTRGLPRWPRERAPTRLAPDGAGAGLLQFLHSEAQYSIDVALRLDTASACSQFCWGSGQQTAVRLSTVTQAAGGSFSGLRSSLCVVSSKSDPIAAYFRNAKAPRRRL